MREEQWSSNCRDSHKWDNAPPFPGFTTLAKRMGISATAARGHADSLESKGYLVRQMRVGTTNRFDLTKLFMALDLLHAFEMGRQAGPQRRRRKMSAT